MKNRFIQMVAAIALPALILWLYYNQSLTEVDVTKAEILPYRHYIYANVEVRPRHIYQIALSQDPNTITKVPWKIGDRVKRWDTLLELDTEESQIIANTVNSRSKNVEELSKLRLSSQWLLEDKKEELDYLKVRFAEGRIPKIDIQKMEIEIQSLENSVEREKYELNQMVEKLSIQKKSVNIRAENNALRSPIDGVVIEIHRHPGEYLAIGEPAIEIISESQLEFIGEVFEDDLDLFKAGIPALVQLNAYGNQIFKGKVDMVFPKNDQAFQKIDVRIELDEAPEAVVAGLKGVAAFQVAYSDFEVLVPATAVFRNRVQVIENDRIRHQAIEIGFRGLFQILIRSGLPAGSLVLTEYDASLNEGDRVRVKTLRSMTEKTPSQLSFEAQVAAESPMTEPSQAVESPSIPKGDPPTEGEIRLSEPDPVAAAPSNDTNRILEDHKKD
jgi:multidrug efflux pump subunit AcrA (membrane-fusion protein)